jgi:tetratricopeptide (TPR) repeat protein
LAEFDLRCAAGDYDTAVSVLLEIDFDYLLLWGHYHLIIQMHERVQGKIQDAHLKIGNLNGLGLAYQYLGDARKSIQYFEQGIPAAQEAKNHQAEGAFLGNLGNTYAVLAKARQAIEFYEQALAISREIGDRHNEGNHLGNLGSAYAELGDARQAIEFYGQALAIAREIGDRRNEGAWLGNLGNAYADLGDARQAIEFFEQALVIRREIGDKYGEANDLDNTGIALLNIEDYQKAKAIFPQAFQIADDISYPVVQLEARWGLAQVFLMQNELLNARSTIETALQYDVPQYNHNARALHGIVALRQVDGVTARGAFVRAIEQADEILAKTPEYYDALDAKGLALCGLILCSGDSRITPTDAIETFRAARKIAPHVGVIKSVLRLFDELAKCDKGRILKDVRKAAEGR